MINDVRAYYNQYFDIKDLPKTTVDERGRTCNVTCCGMILGIDPNIVLKHFLDKYGWTDAFQVEENLIEYLQENDIIGEPITKLAYPNPRNPNDEDFEEFRTAINEGKAILYHKLNHYQLLIGYTPEGYVFNDPAGDRRIAIKDRTRESGHHVVYSEFMLRHEPLYGRCWSIC